MTQQVAPLIPNLGNQAEAMSGAQAMTFTATDRQLIKEIAGEVDKTKSFKEIFFRKDIAHRVENEQSSINPGQDIKVLESRQKAHEKMLENSSLRNPHELIQLSNGKEQNETITGEEDRHSVSGQSSQPAGQPKAMRQETASLVKELNLDPSELFDKFKLDEEELHNLIYRIKELHLKRLLCANENEFSGLTEAIKQETLTSGRPEARVWLAAQLEELTLAAREYKKKLSEALKQFQ